MTWQIGAGESAPKDRSSLKHSSFAHKWKKPLRALYKKDQELMFCCSGPKFQFEASSSKACVQFLLYASSAVTVHSKKDHKAFKDAVQGELCGDGTPR